MTTGTDSSAVNGWGFRRSDHRSGDEKAEHKQPPSVLAPARADRSLGERFPRRLPCPMVEQWCSPGEPSNPVRSGSSPGRSGIKLLHIISCWIRVDLKEGISIPAGWKIYSTKREKAGLNAWKDAKNGHLRQKNRQTALYGRYNRAFRSSPRNCSNAVTLIFAHLYYSVLPPDLCIALPYSTNAEDQPFYPLCFLHGWRCRTTH